MCWGRLLTSCALMENWISGQSVETEIQRKGKLKQAKIEPITNANMDFENTGSVKNIMCLWDSRLTPMVVPIKRKDLFT